MSDVLEQYEFTCMCAFGDVTSPHELLVGSVNGAFCRECYDSGAPSLCWHKPRAQVAALSVVDMRHRGKELNEFYQLMKCRKTA